MGQRSISGVAGLALTLMGAGVTFAFPDMIIPPVWGWVMLATGAALLVWTLLSWLWSIARPTVNFDDVRTWSVSIWPHGSSYGRLVEGDPSKMYFTLHVDVRNLSATQTRVLDFTVTLSTGNPDHPTIRVNAINGFHQPLRDKLIASDLKGAVRERVLMQHPELPLELPPNTALVCQIEFLILQATSSKLKPGAGRRVLEVEIRERRSSLRKTLKFGECYDARLQKKYKGEIGFSHRSLRMLQYRFKRWRALRRKRREINASKAR